MTLVPCPLKINLNCDIRLASESRCLTCMCQADLLDAESSGAPGEGFELMDLLQLPQVPGALAPLHGRRDARGHENDLPQGAIA